MSEVRTQAGRQFVEAAETLGYGAYDAARFAGLGEEFADAVAAIEAEMRAATFGEVDDAIRGEQGWPVYSDEDGGASMTGNLIDRDRVLAVLAKIQEDQQHRHSWSYLTDHTGECNDCGVTAPPFMPGGVHDCRATLAKLQEDQP